MLHLFYTTPQPAKSANTATTRIAYTFHATCTYAFIIVRAGWDSRGKISVMRDGFDAKMCWERDLDSGEQETSEAGAKKAYATLVRDQGSKVNCFNL